LHREKLKGINNEEIIMATIILDYDARNVQAKKALDFILSLGLFQKKEKKSSFERAMKDIEKGKVHRLITPE